MNKVAKILTAALSVNVLIAIALLVLSFDDTTRNPWSFTPAPHTTDSSRTLSTSIKTALLTKWKFTTAAVTVMIIVTLLSVLLPILLQSNAPTVVDKETGNLDIDEDVGEKESFWSVSKVSTMVVVVVTIGTMGIFVAEARGWFRPAPEPEPFDFDFYDYDCGGSACS